MRTRVWGGLAFFGFCLVFFLMCGCFRVGMGACYMRNQWLGLEHDQIFCTKVGKLQRKVYRL